MFNRLHKAYEAVEIGNPLSALTDLTGCLCEHFRPDISQSNTLFHTIFKSCGRRYALFLYILQSRKSPQLSLQNAQILHFPFLTRSLLVAWRSVKSFRTSLFGQKLDDVTSICEYEVLFCCCFSFICYPRVHRTKQHFLSFKNSPTKVNYIWCQHPFKMLFSSGCGPKVLGEPVELRMYRLCLHDVISTGTNELPLTFQWFSFNIKLF